MSNAYMLLSDIDGTLVHYIEGESQGRISNAPDGSETFQFCSSEGKSTIALALPQSATGKQGWISKGSVDAIKCIRNSGIPFALISGARTSTILSRVPHLPPADAVITENGGRIFFASKDGNSHDGLVEDLEWRERHVAAAGPTSQDELDPGAREGPLWDAYRDFKRQGFKLDTKSYVTCFRVDASGASPDDLAAAIKSLPDSLTSTYNLGKADVYPSTSGKAAAGQYIIAKYEAELADSVFLCDDDNDIELARAVGKAYLPSIGSVRTLASGSS